MSRRTGCGVCLTRPSWNLTTYCAFFHAVPAWITQFVPHCGGRTMLHVHPCACPLEVADGHELCPKRLSFGHLKDALPDISIDCRGMVTAG